MTGYQAWAAQFADVEVSVAQYEALSGFEKSSWENIARQANAAGGVDTAPVPVDASFVDPYASVAPLAALPLPVNAAGVSPVAPVDGPKDTGAPKLESDLQPQLQPGKTPDLPLQTFPAKA